MERSCPAGRLRFLFLGERERVVAACLEREGLPLVTAGADGRKEGTRDGRWQETGLWPRKEEKWHEKWPGGSRRRRASVSQAIRHAMPRDGDCGEKSGETGRREDLSETVSRRRSWGLCGVLLIGKRLGRKEEGARGEAFRQSEVPLPLVSTPHAFFSAARPESAARS